MKILTTTIFITLLVMASSPSSAQLGGTTTFSDRYGSNIGSARSYGGTTTFSDRYGSRIGSARSDGGTTTFSDRYGSRIGSARRFDY